MHYYGGIDLRNLVFIVKKIKHFQISYGVYSFTHHCCPLAHLLTTYPSIPQPPEQTSLLPSPWLALTTRCSVAPTQLYIYNQWDEYLYMPYSITSKYSSWVEGDVPAGSHISTTTILHRLPNHWAWPYRFVICSIRQNNMLNGANRAGSPVGVTTTS